jgi:hypothetical protein
MGIDQRPRRMIWSPRCRMIWSPRWQPFDNANVRSRVDPEYLESRKAGFSASETLKNNRFRAAERTEYYKTLRRYELAIRGPR